jgi:peptidyl-dipeptidase Dcp
VFDHYAKHYKTGALMPPELVEKIKRAENFNKGYALTELLAAAELDMQWHMLPPSAPLQDPDIFEKEALDKAHSICAPCRRAIARATSATSGAAATRPATTPISGPRCWPTMPIQWFEENGGLTRANGDRFRQMILSRGNTEDLAALYATWRGRAPKVDAMLKNRGR